MKDVAKNKQTQNKSMTLWLVALVALGSLLLSLYTLNQTNSSEKTSIDMFTKIQADHAKIVFCHNEQIIPCDDEPIRKWNSENPNSVLNVYK